MCQVFACCWKRGRCNRLLLEGADLTVQVSYRHRSMFERPASFHHIANHRVSFSLDDIVCHAFSVFSKFVSIMLN